MTRDDPPAGEVLVGDSAEVMAGLPESSVDCVMFSPPYWNQRDYGESGHMGLEGSVGEYVRSLVEVCGAARRVLRPDGSLWLNIGDKYHRKSKQMIPHRVAIALLDAGWVVRNDVVWEKTNARPESVEDRVATRFEYVFHAAPNKQYHFDLDAIREDYNPESKRRAAGGELGGVGYRDEAKLIDSGAESMSELRGSDAYESMEEEIGDDETALNPDGKNPGDVWRLGTDRSAGWHPATYPPELCERPIRATGRPGDGGVVLDPMCGSGSTLVAAEEPGADWIGIDINEEYAARAAERARAAGGADDDSEP